MKVGGWGIGGSDRSNRQDLDIDEIVLHLQIESSNQASSNQSFIVSQKG